MTDIQARPGVSGPDAFLLALAADGIGEPQAQAAVRRAYGVLADFLASFNSGDAARWAQTLNFPHVRLAGGEVQVWQDAAAYAASNDLRTLSATGWSHSKWDWIRPVQADAEKVHLAVQFTRYDGRDKPQQAFQALYVVTLSNGHWGVQSRSSYAGVVSPGSAF